MNILYVGDIMGELGIEVVEQLLPKLKNTHNIDLTLAQAENVTEGRGISIEDYRKLQKLGIDGFMSGNWTMYRQEIFPMLAHADEPITRPANYPSTTPGNQYKEIKTAKGTVLLISLLGQVVGRDADKPTDNPLIIIDQLLQETSHTKYRAIIVNFHGDYSSEKRVIGYYLDARVTAVIGDHWHVPTADAMVLPKGTAHITDVGMCGTLHSSLGVKLETIITRWRDKQVNRNEMADTRPLQFNAVVIETDDNSGLATSIQSIQHIIP